MRNYKRKPGRVNPDKRMVRAAELRAEGLSLRQIAGRLSCSHDTIWRDLMRWNACNVSEMPVRNSPQRGENLTPESDTDDPNVISLSDRRRYA
jgi:hypothetical protein